MINGRQGHHRLASMALAACLGLGLMLSPAWSDVLVTDLDDPVLLTLKTRLDVETDEAGKHYEAIFNEDYTYLTGMIPEGTRVMGTVEKLRESKRFGRPGYFQLSVERIAFPDGTDFIVSAAEREDLEQKLYHPDAQTKSRIFKSNLASTLAGTTTSATLHAVGVFAFPYAVGARVLAGAVYEGFTGDKDRSLVKRLGKGAYKGTGIPGAIHFVKRSPNPVYEPGDVITLQMEPEILAELFAARPNPNADWYRADFTPYNWDDHDSLHHYLEMAEQLNREPDADFEALVVESQQPQNTEFSDFVKTPDLGHPAENPDPQQPQGPSASEKLSSQALNPPVD